MRKKHITWQLLSTAIISLLMVSAPLLAGSLNPSAPPGPTMKTLDQAPAKDEVIPPWSQTLPANDTGDPCNSARFKCVMGGAAVLDRETGLVWERSPDNTSYIDWYSAHNSCYWKMLGSRKSWRLPTVEEMASLVSTNNYNPALPWGYPFNNVDSYVGYWTATTNVSNTTEAWFVYFLHGGLYKIPKSSILNYVWCVRGGSGINVQ